MLHVFLQGLGLYQDVINVDDEKAVDHIVENLVHNGLENGGGVRKAIGHDQVFVVPSSGDKGSLPVFAFTYTDKVICTSQVYLFKGRWDQRKTVLDRDVIQGRVINTWTETIGEEGQMKPFECFINVVLHCLMFWDREGVNTALRWGHSRE